jgi:uncharacterized protein YndB with AHSA1/START domain
MPDILRDFPIKAPPARVFEAISAPGEMDRWWTKTCSGRPSAGATPAGTQVRFYHRRWSAENERYRVSCHCWALYLRLLRRQVEYAESVPYEKRLDA